MKWRLRPVTLIQWVGLLTSSWDLFSETHPVLQDKLRENKEVRFRDTNTNSYRNLRKLCQISDALLMSHLSNEFQGGLLIAAAIYMQMGLHLEYF